MATLYPRLLDPQAIPIFDEYKLLAGSSGIEEFSNRAAPTHPGAVYVATGGTRVAADRLMSLRGAVVDLAKGAGFPYEHRELGSFDVELARLLHQSAGMVPAEAASRDVWQFMALCLLPDVSFWRFPDPPGDRVLGTDLTRHVFGRLWWRAQLVRDATAEDPYSALSIMGEAAFDQIYARRAVMGGSPTLVRGILEVWKELQEEHLLEGLTERHVLQDYLKRLLRLFPFVDFDSLEDPERKVELRAVAWETISAFRSRH